MTPSPADRRPWGQASSPLAAGIAALVQGQGEPHEEEPVEAQEVGQVESQATPREPGQVESQEPTGDATHGH